MNPPDWTGRTVVIASGGPSITKEQVAMARGCAEVMAISESWKLAPWAPVLYACDWQWWGRKAPQPSDYSGLRVMGVKAPRKYPAIMQRGLDTVDHVANVTAATTNMIFNGRQIGAGSSSAFQAANIAVMWGARRIILLGIDCHSPNEHWHDGHTHIEAPTQNKDLMLKWIKAWRNASGQLKARGIDVVNCSPGSAVDVFRHGDLATELREADAA